MGAPRVELGTSALSGLRSNQLSYAPGRVLPTLCRLAVLAKDPHFGRGVRPPRISASGTGYFRFPPAGVKSKAHARQRLLTPPRGPPRHLELARRLEPLACRAAVQWITYGQPKVPDTVPDNAPGPLSPKHAIHLRWPSIPSRHFARKSPRFYSARALGGLQAPMHTPAGKTVTLRSCCPTRWAENLTTCQDMYLAGSFNVGTSRTGNKIGVPLLLLKPCLHMRPDKSTACVQAVAHLVFRRFARNQCPRLSTHSFYIQLDKPGRKGIARCRSPFAAP